MKLKINKKDNDKEIETFDITEIDYILEDTQYKGIEFQIRQEGQFSWKYFEFIILFVEDEILIYRVNNNDHPELSNKGIVKAMIEMLRKEYKKVIISSTNISDKKIHETEGRIPAVTKYWEKWEKENSKINNDKESGRFKYIL